MPFYVFAWIASVTYGLYTIVAKLIGKYRLKNTWQFSFFSILFGGIVISLIALLNGAGWPSNWRFIILSGLFLTLGFASYIAALQKLDISTMVPLYNMRVIMTVLLGVLFLGESLTRHSISLIGLVVIAGFFAAMDEKFSFKSFFQKNIALAFLNMAILSVQSVFVNRAIAKTDYWTTVMWMSLLSIVFGLAFYPRFKKDLAKSKPKDYLGVLVLALLGGLGDLAGYKAIESNIGISSVIISLPISMILVFFLGFFKPKLLEKHTLKVYLVRFSAAGVMIWSALQLSR